MKTDPHCLTLLAEHAQNAAALLHDAVKGRCRLCISQISDLNREALSDLSDAERQLYGRTAEISPSAISSAYRLTDCVHEAFSAAMLIPDDLPYLPPLCEIAACNEQLAKYPLEILKENRIDFYSLHLAANKGRGAQAILLSNYCSTDGGRRLLPLALAMEAHRNALESACEQLLCEMGA